jgi:hypothetical protein
MNTHLPANNLSLRRAAAFLLAAAFTSGALSHASAMSLRELRALEKSSKQGPNYRDYYLVGLMEGLLEAHAQDVRNGATPTICINGRRLEPHMARPLFDAERKRNHDVYEADMPVQLVMHNALTSSYGC